MAILILSEAKKLLQIPSDDTSKDELITALIPIIEEQICAYCGQKFDDGFPEGIKLPAVSMISLNINKNYIQGIQSESFPDYTYQLFHDGGGGYPQSIINALNLYRRNSFVGAWRNLG